MATLDIERTLKYFLSGNEDIMFREDKQKKKGRPATFVKESKTFKTGEFVVCPLCSKPHPVKYSNKACTHFTQCRSWSNRQIVWFKNQPAKDYLKDHRVASDEVRYKRQRYTLKPKTIAEVYKGGSN